MSFPVNNSIPVDPPGQSLIWGHGQMLDILQRAKLFGDSKITVDLMLTVTPKVALENFQILREKNPNPTKEELMALVKENFSLTLGEDLEDWDPSDWQPNPEYLHDLSSKPLIFVGKEINRLWKVLSRKCSDKLREEPELFSKIYLPSGFVMPGGRFRETYYWDSYWIQRGLLVSKMFTTVRGMLENFFFQIEEFGHIPNGTRKYYINRTQPPFLCSMISKYIEATNDYDFLNDNIGYLEKELVYFEGHRQREYEWNGKAYSVFYYSSDCHGPRPESYLEDMEIAEELFESERERQEFYLHVMAAAESGWDFSSRWFIDADGGNSGTLAQAKTCYILPVDLNALMYKNYVHMAEFYRSIKNVNKEKQFLAKSENMLATMNELFWDLEEHMWFDIDTLNNKRRKSFYASNLFPLWAEAFPKDEGNLFGKFAVDYLTRTGVLNFPGGIPASLQRTKQQWDFNAWPNLQHLIVAGLNKTGNPEALKIAFKLAKKYTANLIFSCSSSSDSCQFFEKYDPSLAGRAGGGGEYEVQMGFGWTNGVLIDFITKYGDDLINSDEYVSKVPVGTYGFNKKVRYEKLEKASALLANAN